MSVLRNLINKRLLPVLLIPLLIHIVSVAANGIVLYALDLGASVLELALIGTIGSSMELAILLPICFLSDKYGRKKMLLLSQSLLLIGDFIRLIASKPLHILVASLFGMGGISEALALVAAIIGDLAIDQHERASATSAVYLLSALGMVLGPTLASMLLQYMKVKMLFHISFFLRLAFILYIIFVLKEPEQTKVEWTDYKNDLINLLKNRNMFTVVFFQFFLFALFSMENTFVPVLARNVFSLSDSEIISLRSIRNFASLLFRLFSNEIFNKVSYKHLIILLFSLSSPTIFLIPFSQNYGWLSMLYFVWGFCFGGLYLLGGVVTSLISERRNRGAAFALNHLSSAAGTFFSMIMANIASTMGVPFVFNIGAILPLLSIVLVSKLMQEKL